MSTVDTHLSWGASYLVNDVYKRFLKKDESEKHYVAVGRGATVLLFALVSFWALREFVTLMPTRMGGEDNKDSAPPHASLMGR